MRPAELTARPEFTLDQIRYLPPLFEREHTSIDRYVAHRTSQSIWLGELDLIRAAARLAGVHTSGR